MQMSGLHITTIFYVSKTISSPASPAVSEILRRKSERMLIHAERVAERISALAH